MLTSQLAIGVTKRKSFVVEFSYSACPVHCPVTVSALERVRFLSPQYCKRSTTDILIDRTQVDEFRVNVLASTAPIATQCWPLYSLRMRLLLHKFHIQTTFKLTNTRAHTRELILFEIHFIKKFRFALFLSVCTNKINHKSSTIRLR